MTYLSVTERFMAKVRKGPEMACWLWVGARSTAGYGHFMLNSRVEKAHRVAYVLFVGKIADVADIDCRGTCVIHSCDVRLCVNPDHLRLGSHRENMQDKRIRNRIVSNPLLGEKHQNSKLTAAQVISIRQRGSAGVPCGSLALEMGVHRATIGDVLSGRTWNHLSQEIEQ